MTQVLSEPSRSIREYRILPGFTARDVTAPSISLQTRLCRGRDGFIMLSMPLVSAAMQAVTGPGMAAAVSSLGGVGVLPLLSSSEAQCMQVRAVKRYRAGFQTDPITFAPTQTIADVCRSIARTGYTTYPVTDTGQPHGRLLGIITDKDFDQRHDLEMTITERMTTDLQVGQEEMSLKDANRMMIAAGRGCLPLVSKEGTLQSVVFKKDLDRHISHPEATVDERKRHLVGAAISTYEQDRGAIADLVGCEVDFLVIDASHGHTAFQKDTLEWIKQRHSVPVVAGNVVTAEGFRMLAESGADAVKIGMGIGSGCTTQAVKATGRGQATAIMEVADTRDDYYRETGVYIPLMADGGLLTPADMAVALAMGADTVMMGNFFARFAESPGPLLAVKGRPVKGYWMEASAKARNLRRYYQSPGAFFEEGVSGYVPFEGSIYDAIPQCLNKLKAAIATAGARSIVQLHQTAVLELQSPGALADAGIHHIQEMDDVLDLLHFASANQLNRASAGLVLDSPGAEAAVETANPPDRKADQSEINSPVRLL